MEALTHVSFFSFLFSLSFLIKIPLENLYIVFEKAGEGFFVNLFRIVSRGGRSGVGVAGSGLEQIGGSWRTVRARLGQKQMAVSL